MDSGRIAADGEALQRMPGDSALSCRRQSMATAMLPWRTADTLAYLAVSGPSISLPPPPGEIRVECILCGDCGCGSLHFISDLGLQRVDLAAAPSPAWRSIIKLGPTIVVLDTRLRRLPGARK